MTKRITFDVFGKVMMAERLAQGWTLFTVGADGKRSPAEVPIPHFVSENEIGQYLDDIFHEAASARHPSVRRLTSD